jgi:hypothetical protein
LNQRVQNWLLAAIARRISGLSQIALLTAAAAQLRKPRTRLRTMSGARRALILRAHKAEKSFVVGERERRSPKSVLRSAPRPGKYGCGVSSTWDENANQNRETGFPNTAQDHYRALCIR